MSEEIAWLQGDVFEELSAGDLLIANLFLHHFTDQQLGELAQRMREFQAICISEPWRSRISLSEGYALWPLVNRVTRHDMVVSIRAGFVRGELPELLGLDARWKIEEQVSLLGACRLIAYRL